MYKKQCKEGEKWVEAYTRDDGTYVHGFCRKITRNEKSHLTQVRGLKQEQRGVINMANYSKTGTTNKTVKMPDSKWEQATKPDLSDTTKYTRWYGDTKVELYHRRGDNKYTYSRVAPYGSYFGDFHATSLKKAQERLDSYYGKPRRSD